MIDPKTLLVLMILASWGPFEVCRRLDRRYRKAHGERK
jgi:hypothetical protein